MRKHSIFLFILAFLICNISNTNFANASSSTTGINHLGYGTYTSSLVPENAVNIYWGDFKDEEKGLKGFVWNNISKEYDAMDGWYESRRGIEPAGVKAAIAARLIDADHPHAADNDVHLRVYLLDYSDELNPKKGKLVFSLWWNPDIVHGELQSIVDCGKGIACGQPIDIPVSEGSFLFGKSYDRGDKIKSNMINRSHFLKREWRGWRKVIAANQPVVVELDIGSNVSVNEISVPGIPSTHLPFFFPQAFENKVVINQVDTYDMSQQIEAKVGDLLTFYVSSPDGAPPVITGLPKTWIARAAQHTQYHVELSHTPGDYTPWIGFDTRTHWINVKNFKQQPSRKPNYPDWKPIEGTNLYKLDYVISHPMISGYNPMLTDEYFHWNKYREQRGATKEPEPTGSKGDAWQKRADQMSGLLMQVMHYWNNDNQPWVDYNGNYRDYNGAKYMMGFDWDEILYVGERHHDGTNGPRAILEDPLRWQIVPKNEGDRITFIQDMVNAFRKFQGGKDYFGFEIQDVGTSSESPYGNGHWIPSSGEITITTADNSLNLTIGAVAPVSKFYSIEGTMWPGNYELSTYKWNGMSAKDIYDTYLASGLFELTVEHTTEDRYSTLVDVPCQFGKLWVSDDEKWATECTYQVYSTSKFDDINIQGVNPFPNPDRPGDWTADTYFSFLFRTSYAYHTDITVYVKNKLTGEKVAISGKMARTRGLGFMEDSNLITDHAIGTGFYFFINTARKVPTDKFPYNEDYVINGLHGGGPKATGANPFEREYRFTQGESSSWWTTDYDVHSFGRDKNNPKVEWHQANYVIANWLYDQDLDAEKMIKYYFDKIEDLDTDRNGYIEFDEMELESPVCESVHCNIDYGNFEPGVYQLTAVYRGAERSVARLKITIEAAGSNLASIKASELTNYDRNLINRLIQEEESKLQPGIQYIVYEADISSKFMYKLGGRNTYGADFHGCTDYDPNPASHPKFKKQNRWSPYSDFKPALNWYIGNNLPSEVPLDKLEFDNTMGWKFSVDGQLVGQDESDLDYSGRPVTEMFPVWGNHFSSNWMKAGPTGEPGPAYQPTAGFTSDINDFSTEIRTYFEDLHRYYPGYYQLNVPLASYSDSYGYFLKNINTSHIYDLNKIFDVNTGAFTGNGVSSQNFSGPDYAHQPRPSDNFMNLQLWYYDLITGRKFIVKKSDIEKADGQWLVPSLASDMSEELSRYSDPQAYLDNNSLKQANWRIEDYSLVELCAPCEWSVSVPLQARMISANEGGFSKSGFDESPYSIYPNPVTNGRFTITFNSIEESPIKVTIADAAGKLVFSQEGRIDTGKSELTLEDISLPDGVYIISSKIAGKDYSDQVIFLNEQSNN